jgi:trehalose/maltose hydrolase-like predicted phosphorylase
MLLEERGDTMPTTIVNGVFDLCDMFSTLPPSKEEQKYLEPDYFAEAGPSPSVANLPNPLHVRVFVDGSELSFSRGIVTGFTRKLNLRDASYSYRYTITGKEGRRTRIDMVRFCDAVNIHRAYVRYAVTPLNYSGRISLASGIDGSLVSNVVKDRQFDVTAVSSSGPGTCSMTALTRDRHISIYEDLHNTISVMPAPACRLLFTAKGLTVAAPGKSSRGIAREMICEDKVVSEHISANVQKGQAFFLEKVMVVSTTEDKRHAAVIDREQELACAVKDGFAGAYVYHRDCWKGFWRRCDVGIDGDQQAQQYLRFCLYHLVAAAPRHTRRLGVPVKLLTGEYYQGTTFYDTDTYIVPFYTFTQPAWARNCLEWRFAGLRHGRRIAAELGYKGAKLAWQAGPYGEECLGKWWRFVHSNIHINADVVYALMQYYDTSGDETFMLNRGVELLIESARFYASRTRYSRKNDCYQLQGVSGPDEGHCTSTDNFYTNYLVKQNLLIAADIVESVRDQYPRKYETLAAKLDFKPAECRQWRRIAEKIRFLYDPETHIYEQYDGFYALLPVGDDFFARRRDRKEWFAPVRPYQAIHQPDVIMAMLLYRHHFSPDVFRANQAYYYPRTMNFSSMSYSLNAIACAETGDMNEAYKNFIITAGMDIDQQLTGRMDTAAGIHGTSCGGAWMAAVFGFGGVQFIDGCLHITPRLPRKWKSLSCMLVLKNEEFSITVTRKNVTVKGGNCTDVEIPACILGQDVIIQSGSKICVR